SILINKLATTRSSLEPISPEQCSHITFLATFILLKPFPAFKAGKGKLCISLLLLMENIIIVILLLSIIYSIATFNKNSNSHIFLLYVHKKLIRYMLLNNEEKS